MRHRKTLRLLALSVGAIALLLSGSAGGLSGDASTARLARGAAAPKAGAVDPAIDASPAGLDAITYAHASRVDTTRPASIDAASPDPTGLSPSVEFSASEATPFECALDGVVFAECTSPPESSDGLDTFSAEGPTATEDDPTLAIEDVSTLEGDTGTVDAGFTVTLSAASTTTVTVDYATAGVSATSGTDFQSSSGTLTFDPGDTSEPMNVPVNGDLVDEDSETFTVTLSAPSGAALPDGQAVGTIIDNDAAPSLSIDHRAVAEGAGATFTVTLSAVSGQQVTVDYASVTGTATAADFNAVANTLDFAPGETTKAIPVATNDDALDEDTENYTIALSAASNATIADDLGFGTIIDNDAPPTLSISDVILIEGRRAQSPRT